MTPQPGSPQDSLALCTATLQPDPMQCSFEDLLLQCQAAASGGFGGVSLWHLHWGMALGSENAGGEAVLRAAVSEKNLTVHMIEAILPWMAGADSEATQQALDAFKLAESFGATRVLAVCMGEEIQDRAEASKRYREICKVGSDFGVSVPIEFLPWSSIPDITTAWQMVETAGEENGGILIDVWHWQRQPGGPDHEQLQKIPGEFIRAVQLCDAAETPQGEALEECMTARLLPGQGAVNIPELLGSLKAIGAEPLWAPEVFSQELAARGHKAMVAEIYQSSLDVLAG